MTPIAANQPDHEEPLSLDHAATQLLNECRMVLPGIQALFGFQLVAVFSTGFSQKLSPGEQQLHLGATVLVTIAVALVMTPAALHRQIEPRAVSEGFIAVSSRLLLWSMIPLALGICTDLYLVAWSILRREIPAVLIAVLLLGIFLVLWFALPRSEALRRLAGEGDTMHHAG